MRNAICLGLTAPVTVLASQPGGDVRAITIVKDWAGDLDQLVGEHLTLAEALGEDLLKHFTIEKPVRESRSHRAGSSGQE